MIRNRFFRMACAVCLVALPGFVRAQSGFGDLLRVRVNGERVRFTNQGPIEQSGRVLVPLRGILEKLGAFVEYDSETKEIVATRGETRIEMQVDSRRALVDGQTVRLDVPAKVYSGSVLVPLRFVGESLGADVSYVAARRTVDINTTDNPNPIPEPEPEPTPEPGTSIRGIVTTIAPDTTPRRLTVRTAAGLSRALLVAENARVQILRDGEYVPYTFMRIKRGNNVEVTRNNAGRVDRIRVRGTASDEDGAVVDGSVTGIINEPSRRILTLRTQLPDADGNRTRTVRLATNARIRLDSGDGTTEVATFAQIRRGDTVRVEINTDERATLITIVP